MDITELFGQELSRENLMEISPLALAFVGDGVHTMFVRNHIVKKGCAKVGDYHAHSAHFCKASFQGEVLDKISETLSEEEKDIVRRARNVKSHNIAKNSDIETYKKATSFEALVGFLFLTGKYERMEEILRLSIGEE